LKQDPAKDEGAAAAHATSEAANKSRYRDALRHRDRRMTAVMSAGRLTPPSESSRLIAGHFTY
jgi:hypothetical protein